MRTLLLSYFFACLVFGVAAKADEMLPYMDLKETSIQDVLSIYESISHKPVLSPPQMTWAVSIQVAQSIS